MKYFWEDLGLVNSNSNSTMSQAILVGKPFNVTTFVDPKDNYKLISVRSHLTSFNIPNGLSEEDINHKINELEQKYNNALRIKYTITTIQSIDKKLFTFWIDGEKRNEIRECWKTIGELINSFASVSKF